MVIAIEYMSDFLVGPLFFLNPNLSGSRSSRGAQRMVPSPANDVVDVVAVVIERTSLVTLVNPTSVRSARIPTVMRIFPYAKLSTIVGNGYGNRTPLRSPWARSRLWRY
jgi:hypothetical protein